MKKIVLILFVIVLLFSVNSKAKEAGMSIPIEKYTLKNGLTVVLHEDKSDPIAAVAIYYHVGSSREVTGKTGFAHLFEHSTINFIHRTMPPWWLPATLTRLR